MSINELGDIGNIFRTRLNCDNQPPTTLLQGAVEPLQLVAITGRAIDIASTCGRPHPSPAATCSRLAVEMEFFEQGILNGDEDSPAGYVYH